MFVCTIACGVLAPLLAHAQHAVKVVRIGYLASDLNRSPRHLVDAFLQGLRERGYVEGRNILIEYRDAEGKLDRLPALAANLATLNVDVIFAPATAHVLAAKPATSTIPIVFADVSDPIALGLVKSLARPGGNMTGLTNQNPELMAKWFQLITQTVPRGSRFGFLYQPGIVPQGFETSFLAQAASAAKTLDVRLQLVAVHTADDFDKAFFDLVSARADGLVVWAGSMFILERKRIVDLADRNRLPAIYSFPEFVADGGLMSYSTNIADNFRRAAGYVDKILKGAKPADLSVEQPTKFQFAINRITAKKLGLSIPPSLLLQADQVIE